MGRGLGELAGELGGGVSEWFSKAGIPPEKRNKIDYAAYAHEVYFTTGIFIVLSSFVFLIVFSICFRIIVRIINLFREEPIVN